MAFYNQTIAAVNSGKDNLRSFGVPVSRPTDFFCEHVKSDAHMAKVCVCVYVCMYVFKY